MIRPILALGLAAGGFAGVMAYLIALDEAQHHFTNRADRQREALHTGAAAFVWFVVASAVIGLAVSAMFH